MSAPAGDPTAWTFDQHRDAVLEAVRRQERHIDPGGDWAPVLLLDAGRIVVEMPVALFNAARTGTATHVIASTLIERFQAAWFARVQGIWARETTQEELDGPPAPFGSVASSPDRVEKLLVLLGNRDRHELWTADVYRVSDRARPKLGEWERHKVYDPGVLTDGVLRAASGLRPTDG